jgi:16S rRNA C967 or C1407 C5-methylase (RsmB/RsmF family)
LSSHQHCKLVTVVKSWDPTTAESVAEANASNRRTSLGYNTQQTNVEATRLVFLPTKCQRYEEEIKTDATRTENKKKLNKMKRRYTLTSAEQQQSLIKNSP